MPRTPIAQTLAELERLAQSVTAEVQKEASVIESTHRRLQSLLDQIRKNLTRRDFYEARKQEATRKAQDGVREAKIVATFLRRGLTLHYGADNEQLERFAIKPARTRKRARKPKRSP